MLSDLKPNSGDTIFKDHIATAAGAFTGELFVVDPTTEPTSPSISNPGSGAIIAGTYNYKYTFAIRNVITDAIIGETLASGSATTAVVLTAPSSILVSGIAISENPHVNTRRVYRSTNGGPYLLINTILDNVTTSFTDNTTTQFSNAEPSSNTTGESLTVGVSAGDPRAISIQEAGTDTLIIDSTGQPTRGPIDGIIDRITTSQADNQAATQTTSEGTVYTYTLDQGILGNEGGVRLFLYGDFLQNAVATLTLRIKFGGTTLFTTTGGSWANDGNRRSWEIDLTGFNTSSTTQKWMCFVKVIDGVSLTFGAASKVASGYTTSAIDTSVDQSLVVTIQSTASSPNISWRRQLGYLRLIPPL